MYRIHSSWRGVIRGRTHRDLRVPLRGSSPNTGSEPFYSIVRLCFRTIWSEEG
jgi:hypothetical protein